MIVSVAGNERAASASEVLGGFATDPELSGAVAEGGTPDEAPMTDAEFEALADLEASIADSWWEMGRSFAQIKAKRLYRRNKDGIRRTWEEYCKEAHGLTKQQVDKIIRATASVTPSPTATCRNRPSG